MIDTTTQAGKVNCFSAEVLLEGSHVLEQVIALRNSISRSSDGTIIDYDDAALRIQLEVDALPSLELQVDVAPGTEGAYQRQLIQALEKINDDHDRVLRKVIKLKSRMLEAISLMTNKRAQFAAFYMMAIPIGVQLASITVKPTAAHAKEMAAAEFSHLMDGMDSFASSMVSELEILEGEIKHRKKTQADKYALGKDQVNAMWNSIQSPSAIGLDDDHNALLTRRAPLDEEDDEMPSFVSKHSKEARVSASSTFLKAPNDTLCSICGEKQNHTPSGDTCPNGHGGAPAVDDIKGTFFKRGEAKPMKLVVDEDGEVVTMEIPNEFEFLNSYPAREAQIDDDDDNGAEELNVAQGYDNLDELDAQVPEEPVTLIEAPDLPVEDVMALRADADECITDPDVPLVTDYEAIWDAIEPKPVTGLIDSILKPMLTLEEAADSMEASPSLGESKAAMFDAPAGVSLTPAPEPAAVIDDVEAFLNSPPTISTPAPGSPRKKLILLEEDEVF
jgi:hypothetical protein